MSLRTKSKIIGLSLITCLGLMTSAQAGRIGPLVQQAEPAHSSGFGGWNLDNVNVKVTDLDYNVVGSFDKTDGSYIGSADDGNMQVGDTFESDIYDSLDTSGNVLIHLHGKNWPVGEPSGIKVMNHTDPTATISRNRPASCIMTTSFLEGTYLDSETPVETKCNSDFQTHKRFKLNMLPAMVDGVDSDYGQGVNLSFNVEAESHTRRYTILQKINNYTGKRLDGYKVELGFVDADGNFTKASVLGADINLSIGEGENVVDGIATDIWGAEDLASFSHGLFGPQTYEEPIPHFPTDGFFDSRSAGFYVDLNDTTRDVIESTGPLPSNYTALPVPYGEVAGQFGDWLTSAWAPKGIFWDDDNDPSTDAVLMAFWGDRGDGNYTWMKGDRDDFQEVTALDLTGWASSPVHAVDTIEDVLNLGLTYIVEVGDISTFPVSKFTLRITPHVAAVQTEPGYVSNTPTPLSDYLSSAGTVTITPSPEFEIGTALQLVLADKDLQGTASVDVNVSVGPDNVWKVIALTEVENRAVFTASLPTTAGTAGITDDGNITIKEGSVVTVTYIDADNGTTNDVPVTATTKASSEPVTPPVNNDTTKGIFATMDNVSLFAMIFGFLVIGGLIARRKLAKQ